MCQVMCHAEVVRPVSPKFDGICEIMLHMSPLILGTTATQKESFRFSFKYVGDGKNIEVQFWIQEGNNIIIIFSG